MADSHAEIRRGAAKVLACSYGPTDLGEYAADQAKNVLALLAELEQAERRIAELETALDNCRDSLNG